MGKTTKEMKSLPKGHGILVYSISEQVFHKILKNVQYLSYGHKS